MSCTSPRTVAITMVPLPDESDFSMCGSSRATAFFITSADCSTNGSCISPAPKRSPTTFMPSSSWSLMMPSGGHAFAAGEVQVLFEALAFAVDDAPLQAFAGGQRREFRGALVLERCGVDAGEQVQHDGQGVVRDVAVGVVFAAVIDEVQGHLALFLREGGERHDLGGVDDAAGQARLHGLVQEHRVQGDARCRVQAEGHVGDAEGGVDAGVLGGDLADGLDGFDAVPAGLFLAGGDGEGQGVDDDVLDAHPPFAHQGVDEAGGDGHLALGGAGLALFVDGQGDHGGAVFLHERHDAREAALRAVAVLVVDGVDHRAAADEFEPGLQHGRFGGVDDEREGGGRRET